MDKATIRDLEKILRFYEAHTLRDRPSLDRAVIWDPTPLPILLQEMLQIDFWYKGEGKKHEGKALVAGFGDGRDATCLNRMGYDVFAGEINPKLVQYSNPLFQQLAKEGLIDPSKLKIVQGDFLDDSIYIANGLKFRDFDKIFAYLLPQNLTKLLEKFEKEAKQGAELFALYRVEWSSPETGLKPINTSGTLASSAPVPHHELLRYRKI